MKFNQFSALVMSLYYLSDQNLYDFLIIPIVLTFILIIVEEICRMMVNNDEINKTRG